MWNQRKYGVVVVTVAVLTACLTTGTDFEVRDDVYMTNDLSFLPLATTGYDIYLIGEEHGQQEVHQLFRIYVEMLYETAGIRDVILEANQHAEEEANAYVLGETATMPVEYWNRLDRLDVLEDIRAFNEKRPNEEKIRVHLVDVDFPLSQLYTHITELITEIDADVVLPTFEEFTALKKSPMLVLVDELREAAADNENVLNELNTIEATIRWWFAIVERDMYFQQYREEALAENIRCVIDELDGAPVAVLYGAWHAQKYSFSNPMRTDPWACRLTEDGISIFSVLAAGISGKYWYESLEEPAGIYTVDTHLDRLQFSDGTTFGEIFDAHPSYAILYVDLSAAQHADIRTFSYSNPDLLPLDEQLAKLFDGVVLFRTVTPSRDNT